MTPSTMDIDARLNILDCFYAVYDRFAGSLETACRKHCAECCTCNVTLTTLEAYRMVTGLTAEGRDAMRRHIEAAGSRRRFRPQLTVNAIAEHCLQGREIPEESADPSWGRCPLLEDDLCSAYPVRPLGCRCFVSRQPCRPNGSADVEERVVSVNHVFLQMVEHLDAAGCSGNLTDVLSVLTDEGNSRQYRQGTLRCRRSTGLIANRPVKALMIPPRHRKDLEPILAALRACFPC